MTNTDPLAQLKDIHLPDPISWWPLAPGWYVLIILFLMMILFLMQFLYKRYHQAQAKKHALLLLQSYQEQYEHHHNAPLISARISELLRRVALVYYPRDEVASLYGKDWLNFLNKTGKKIDFDSVHNLLLEVPFKTADDTDLKPLFHKAKLWIKQRRQRCLN